MTTWAGPAPPPRAAKGSPTWSPRSALGKAGIVLSLECSRLARNNALFRYRNKVFCSAYGFMPRRDEEFLPRW